MHPLMTDPDAPRCEGCGGDFLHDSNLTLDREIQLCQNCRGIALNDETVDEEGFSQPLPEEEIPIEKYVTAEELLAYIREWIANSYSETWDNDDEISIPPRSE